MKKNENRCTPETQIGVPVHQSAGVHCTQCMEYAKHWCLLAENSPTGIFGNPTIRESYQHSYSHAHSGENATGDHFFIARAKPKRRKGKVLDFANRGQKTQ